LVPLSLNTTGTPGLRAVDSPETTISPVKWGSSRWEPEQTCGGGDKREARVVRIDWTRRGTLVLLWMLKTTHRTTPGYRSAGTPSHDVEGDTPEKVA
jgi:hypothetical protein